jgi:hypothetical protein
MRVDVYGYPVWPGSPSYSYSEDQAIERPSRGVSSTTRLAGEETEEEEGDD